MDLQARTWTHLVNSQWSSRDGDRGGDDLDSTGAERGGKNEALIFSLHFMAFMGQVVAAPFIASSAY